MSTTASEPRGGQRAWRIALAGTLVSSLGRGLTLPFLLVYLHGALHVPLAVAGLVVSLSAVLGMAATTGSGPLGDRIGLGRMLAVGLAVQAVGTALLALGGNVAVAAAGVALNGAGNGMAWPALIGLVALQLPPAARPRAYAVRFGVLNAGLGVGSLVSGWVVSLEHPSSFQLVYGVDAATTAVFALLVVAGMRGTPGWAPGALVRERPAAEARGYRAVLADRPYRAYLLCALALGVFGYAQLSGPWAAFATLTAGASTQAVGVGFAVNTAAIVALQLPVVHLVRRWRRSRMLLATCLLWAAAWALTGVAADPALRGVAGDVLLTASLGVFGVGETFLSPVSGALPNSLAPEHLRARYNALASTTWPLGALIGPPMAGVLLGSTAPLLWVVVVVAGMLLTGAAVVRLGRLLPTRVDRAPVEQPD